MKAPLLASHDREGTTKVRGWLLDRIEGARGTFPCAKKLPLAPSNSPPPHKNHTKKKQKKKKDIDKKTKSPAKIKIREEN
ncbi:hypothetical protein, partial [Desulfovibrio sp.]|uniref:hypothetical protein n=1 Tax=Desulfovibrio sp. TaxID=885 RepID=UPI00307CA471